MSIQLSRDLKIPPAVRLLGHQNGSGSGLAPKLYSRCRQMRVGFKLLGGYGIMKLYRVFTRTGQVLPVTATDAAQAVARFGTLAVGVERV